jgi:hypothetical protein
MSGAYRGLRRACTSAVGVKTRFLVEYEPIRSDPRFNELLRRVHLRQADQSFHLNIMGSIRGKCFSATQQRANRKVAGRKAFTPTSVT